jgi:uncharacterized protein (DUF302 family)
MRRVLCAVFLLFVFFAATVEAADFGVYLKSVEKAAGGFDETVRGIEKALGEKGWLIVASYEVSVPDGCGFRARTIAVHSPTYAGKLLARGVRAAFALPVRIVVYEDEGGTHAAFMNPSSVNRTVLGDGVAEALAAETAAEISAIVAGAAGGTKVDRQAGQMRSKGRVSGPKMMGGGKFDDRVEILFEKAAGEGVLEEVAGKVKAGIEGSTTGWGLVYTLDLLPQGAIVLGVNSKSMEARAYGIAGDKRKSDTSPCPGIDHAAAFPIEVVVMEEGTSVKVAILDGMYRMKLFFEDAGKMAFAKNMTMPGSIEKEIRQMVLAELK